LALSKWDGFSITIAMQTKELLNLKTQKRIIAFSSHKVPSTARKDAARMIQKTTSTSFARLSSKTTTEPDKKKKECQKMPDWATALCKTVRFQAQHSTHSKDKTALKKRPLRHFRRFSYNPVFSTSIIHTNLAKKITNHF
jgi:hypothetical protein